MIYDFIEKTDYKNFADLRMALFLEDAKPFLQQFKQISNKPKIVTEKEFQKRKSPLLFSGVRELDKSVDWFQNGEFKWRDGLLGRGFYFTDSYKTARLYAIKGAANGTGGIMVAKTRANARIIKENKLCQMVKDDLPSENPDSRIPRRLKSIADKASVVGTFLRLPYASTLRALFYDKDIISGIVDMDKCFCVVNRAAIMQPKNPDAKNFVEKD